MKNSTKNKFLGFAVLSALLLCGMQVRSQSIIYDGNQIVETSIIRNYKNNNDKHETLSGRDYYLQEKLWRLDDGNPNRCVKYTNIANTGISIVGRVSDFTPIIKGTIPRERTYSNDIKISKIIVECEE